MSFDLMLFKDPPGADPANAPTLPLGTVRDVRQTISAAFPQTIWEGAEKGWCAADTFRTEIVLGTDSDEQSETQKSEEILERLNRQGREATTEELEELEQLRPKPPAETEPVTCISFHFRGGSIPVGELARLCREEGWSVLDCQEGEVVDLARLSELNRPFSQWKSFRDSVSDQ